jgi:hypothetical protein
MCAGMKRAIYGLVPILITHIALINPGSLASVAQIVVEPQRKAFIFWRIIYKWVSCRRLCVHGIFLPGIERLISNALAAISQAVKMPTKPLAKQWDPDEPRLSDAQLKIMRQRRATRNRWSLAGGGIG